MIKIIVEQLLRRITEVGPYIGKKKVTTIMKGGDKVTIEQPIFLAVDQGVLDRYGRPDFRKVAQITFEDRFDALLQLYSVVKNELIKEGKEGALLHSFDERDMIKEHRFYELLNYCIKVLRDLDIITSHDRFFKSTVLKEVGGVQLPVGQKMLSEAQVDKMFNPVEDDDDD